MSKLNVAVLFGGVSNEHEISLRSSANIIRSIPKDKYNIIPIGITKKGRWLFFPGDVSEIENGNWETDSDCTPAVILPDPMYRGILKYNDGKFSIEKIDVVYPAVHGKNCEDGVLQGVLDMSGIPYVGSGSLASAICMDKCLAHLVLEREGIKMARWKVLRRDDLEKLDSFCADVEANLGFPVCVKPACSGSSVGVNKARDIDELKSAVKTAFSHDDKALVEEYIVGRELEVAVMGNSPTDTFTTSVGEILSANEMYDYDAKYVNTASSGSIPEDIHENGVSREIKETAVLAYRAAGCKGLSRIDFFSSENGVYLNEINTLPGFTNISMYPKLMEDAGIPASDLIDKLIQLCLELHGEI
ncbi:MAG: D-alanine--D-alanine ligase [Ruminococcus sp.]|jgi:D-alanine-D-alanine ligase|nr:D-alanine--D-alanine ligase [Ruminococcus sp.]